jgi:hypothetical protein
MKTIIAYLITFALTTLFLTSSVIADEQLQNPKIYDSLTMRQIATIMKDQGYSVEFFDDDEAMAWTLNGDEVCMIDSDEPNSLNLYTYVEEVPVTLDDINAWNKDNNLSKTFIDEDNAVTLHFDLDITGGVTEGRIIDFFKTCEINHRAWLNQVIKKPEAN